MKVISLPRGGLCVFTDDGVRMVVTRDADGRLWVDQRCGQSGARSVVEEEGGLRGTRREGEGAASDGVVRAPAGGRVTALLVELGASVEAGAALAIVELMKAEVRVPAPAAGRVVKVHVGVGESVERGAPILSLEAEAE
jgi:biotin carboxyl carrier protein